MGGQLDPTIVDAVHRAIHETRTSDALVGSNYLLDRRVFRFAQYLRSVAGTSTPARVLLPYLELWWTACAEAIADDQDNMGQVIDLTWQDVCRQFEVVWAKCTIYPIGDYWVAMAGLPEPDLPCINRYERSYVRKLASAMYHASRDTQDRRFYMSQADAGRVMGRSQAWGGHILGMLLADGLIRQVKLGYSGVASLYQWVGDHAGGPNGSQSDQSATPPDY